MPCWGAASLGDIGEHFPDTDEQYEGISSLLLLEETGKKVREAGYAIVNIDVVLIAEKPKVAPLREKMRMNISDALGMSWDDVSIKATTTEGMGFTGRGEASPVWPSPCWIPNPNPTPGPFRQTWRAQMEGFG